MSPDELKALEKELNRRKRIAGEWASQLHDLVEDRLPAAYEELHGLAQSTYEACKAWREVSDQLKTAQAGVQQ